MLVTYAKVSSGFKFEIMGSTTSGYVAAGLSDDEKMVRSNTSSFPTLEQLKTLIIMLHFVMKIRKCEMHPLYHETVSLSTKESNETFLLPFKTVREYIGNKSKMVLVNHDKDILYST